MKWLSQWRCGTSGNAAAIPVTKGAIASVPQISADSGLFSALTWLELASPVLSPLEKRGAFPVK
jgi:hypothetical protein